MRSFIKKIFTLFIFFSLSLTVYCQDSTEEISAAESDFSGDLDDLFSEAEDLDEAVVTEEDSSNEFTLNVGSLKLPLSVTGRMDAEVGLAYSWEDGNHDGSAYFDFKNKISFLTRPDKYLALRGSFKTSMPDNSETEVDGQNHYFYLYELYFDYLFMQRIYLTAGKKDTTWGNVRLFTNIDDYEDDDDALFTNVLNDSRNNVSGTIRVPAGPFTFTAICMFKDSVETPGWRELSFAGNAELILWNTCINLFGRTFPERSGKTPDQWKNPMLGVEVKRTILGIDFYFQELAKISEEQRFRNIVRPSFYEKESFKNFVTTAGFYYFNTDKAPNWGIDFEYQNIYYPNDVYLYYFYKDPDNRAPDYYGDWYWANEDYKGADSKEKALKLRSKGDSVNRFALNFGMSKLGKDRKLKVGLQWNHNITDKSGFVKPGVIFSRVFPHCDWNYGIKYEYGEEYYKKYHFGKITIGSYFKISLDY